ncbi:hypothetical protein RJ641_019184 [Dillenia turbinata]|uniref:Uncharacterized protein n=1 Tax=Dillenia turbinata TaxID=194707 RepID=A0AAN8Z0K0_9MAGN
MKFLFYISQTIPVNTKPFLNYLTGKRVIVKLKWGYGIQRCLHIKFPFLSGSLLCIKPGFQGKGPRKRKLMRCPQIFVCCLQLANIEEYIEGQFTGNLGEILIRYLPWTNGIC